MAINLTCPWGQLLLSNGHLNRFSSSRLEVQCDHPPPIKDGFIEVANFKDSYIYGSKATYHCNPGFILWGNAVSYPKSDEST